MWVAFFFSSRRRHTSCSRDWSSDVCSSDLDRRDEEPRGPHVDRSRGVLGPEGERDQRGRRVADPVEVCGRGGGELGRASCRERELMSVLLTTSKKTTFIPSNRSTPPSKTGW